MRRRFGGWLLGVLKPVVSRLPEGTALSLGPMIGFMVGSVLRIRRSETEEHLALAFPGAPSGWYRRIARRCYAHLASEAIVVLGRTGWSKEAILERTTAHGFDDFRAAVDAGRGVLLLTGHLGNWEMGGAAVAARDIDLDVIGKGMADRGFEAHLMETRRRLGMRIIEMGDVAAALRALTQGRVLAVLGDQRAHRGGVSVPFFGRDAATTRGPAVLAGRTGAQVWVAFAIRETGRPVRYTLQFERLPFVSSGDVEQDTRVLMGAFGRALETAIRSAPEQYFWQHLRWKSPPAEEQGSEA